MIYKINMSKGGDIKIDEEDLIHLQKNLSAPLIRLKQAIINPSFMVSITPTEEDEFTEKPKIEVRENMAAIVEIEKIPTLSDKMNINKLLK